MDNTESDAFKRWQQCWQTLALSAVLVGTPCAYAATQPTGEMLTPRDSHAAAALPDGRILITGGMASTSLSASVEIYDPVTATFSTAPSLSMPRVSHVAIQLQDGKVLVAGGLGRVDGANSMEASTEFYDPATAQWHSAGPLAHLYHDPVAHRLPNGKALIFDNGYFSNAPNAELYDPQSGTFSDTGVLSQVRIRAASVVLADGRVLVAGGRAKSGETYFASAEIWDAATGQWAPTGALNQARMGATATLLSDGRVLIAGGNATNNSMIASAEIYDPATGTFSITGALLNPRSSHQAQRLADGSVLVGFGNTPSYGVYTSFERYDPATGTWAAAGSSPYTRFTDTWSPLPSGQILIAGDYTGNPGSAEIYDPVCGPAVATVSPTTIPLASNGGPGVISLNYPANCPWTLHNVPAWLNITSLRSGTGPADIQYVAAPNPAQSQRYAQLEVAAATINVTQAIPCDPYLMPTIFPTIVSASNQGMSGSITVTFSNQECTWTTRNVPAWITITSGASGKGNGVINYTVGPNPAGARSGDITITTASQLNRGFILNQAAASTCGATQLPTFFPESVNLSATGGSSSVSIIYNNPDCSWSVTAKPAWLAQNGGSSAGYGNGTYSFVPFANTSGSARSGVITVTTGNGLTKDFPVSQMAGAAQGGNCTPRGTLLVGTQVSNSLTTTACKSGARGASYYTDRYTLTATPGQRIAVLLSSTAFDSYLYLKDAAGNVLTSDDDGGGGRNSRIPANSGYFTLPASSTGPYTVEVSTYGTSSTGSYTLLLTQP
ncbi:hypothetical protein IGB42_02552 [Andreprevotia sp. IGB-42]|uniref:kelch repeat-containing protein n=1 Tax=Andreprevotia sp. IGB-42 TaxID=2497473 RepID=UPI001357913B|nr:kelch repeat-containing protein [Andreprevotia sp. IGB-42]KAF0813151.1 hypothetical protein IGB42_02552 [Andreprevotia sp. IGB-42]